MSFASTPHVKNVSLDELVALADEMAALARMGVPLERGLTDVADDLSRRESKLALAISSEMRAGKSLSQVLASMSNLIPAAYRAVVEAGARSGRLSSALEGLASSARRAAEMRRMARSALVYPLLVAGMAYTLFLISVTFYQPFIGDAYADLHVPTNSFNHLMISWGRTALVWGPLVPLLLIVPLGLWMYRSRSAAYRETGVLSSLPTQRLMACGRIATFADVMALLVGHEVPLGESIVLAAEASGDSGLQAAAYHMASDIARGGILTPPQGTRGVFPPFLYWLLAGRADRPQLVESLRNMAQSYHRQAERIEERMRLYLPVLLTIAVGGTAVMLYALSVLLPWYSMLTDIPLLK